MACEGLCIIYKNEGRFAEARELLTVINSEGYEYEEIDRLFDELNQEKELFKEFSRYDSN